MLRPEEMRAMLRVTVELVPGGAEPFRRTIGAMIIVNMSNLAEISNYAITVTEEANPLTGAPSRRFQFTLHGQSRRRSAWALIERAITEMDSEEPTAS
jgi:hypothetical protein